MDRAPGDILSSSDPASLDDRDAAVRGQLDRLADALVRVEPRADVQRQRRNVRLERLEDRVPAERPPSQRRCPQRASPSGCTFEPDAPLSGERFARAESLPAVRRADMPSRPVPYRGESVRRADGPSRPVPDLEAWSRIGSAARSLGAAGAGRGRQSQTVGPAAARRRAPPPPGGAAAAARPRGRSGGSGVGRGGLGVLRQAASGPALELAPAVTAGTRARPAGLRGAAAARRLPRRHSFCCSSR